MSLHLHHEDSLCSSVNHDSPVLIPGSMFRMLPSRVDSTLCVESVHDSVVWTLLCFWRFCFLAGAEEEIPCLSLFSHHNKMAGKSCPRTIRLRYYMTILHHDPGGACLLARRARLLQMGGKAPAHRDRMGGEQKAQKSVFLSLPKCRTPTFATCQNFNSKKSKERSSLRPHFAHMSHSHSPHTTYIYTAIYIHQRDVCLCTGGGALALLR